MLPPFISISCVNKKREIRDLSAFAHKSTKGANDNGLKIDDTGYQLAFGFYLNSDLLHERAKPANKRQNTLARTLDLMSATPEGDLNVVHFSKTAGEKTSLYEDAKKIFEAAGDHCHAIQINDYEPDDYSAFAIELAALRKDFPDKRIILTGFDIPEDRLRKILPYSDYFLIDASKGEGRELSTSALKEEVSRLQAMQPGINIAIAGGLGPGNVGIKMSQAIRDLGMAVSIDAESGLRWKFSRAAKDDGLDVGYAQDYLSDAIIVAHEVDAIRAVRPVEEIFPHHPNKPYVAAAVDIPLGFDHHRNNGRHRIDKAKFHAFGNLTESGEHICIKVYAKDGSEPKGHPPNVAIHNEDVLRDSIGIRTGTATDIHDLMYALEEEGGGYLFVSRYEMDGVGINEHVSAMREALHGDTAVDAAKKARDLTLYPQVHDVAKMMTALGFSKKRIRLIGGNEISLDEIRRSGIDVVENVTVESESAAPFTMEELVEAWSKAGRDFYAEQQYMSTLIGDTASGKADIRDALPTLLDKGGQLHPVWITTYRRLGDKPVHPYNTLYGERGHFSVIFGDPAALDKPEVRTHAECFTGDMIGSGRCDCYPQMAEAIDRFAANGNSILAYTRQEGRDIGLKKKLQAYICQIQFNISTYVANFLVGRGDDHRQFDFVANMIKTLGIDEISLRTNNPKKIAELGKHGLNVSRIQNTGHHVCEHNAAYLGTKTDQRGHQLGPREEEGDSPAAAAG